MMPNSLRSRLRRDGSVTWWSVAKQQWLSGWAVPEDDLRAMSPREAQRVVKHLQRTGKAKPCACQKKGKKH